jgi:hypothetical protein
LPFAAAQRVNPSNANPWIHVFGRLRSVDSNDYQPDRDGAARNLSKTSLIRFGVSFLSLAALSVGPMD